MNKDPNPSSSIGKKLIEICLISARGQPRPTLWKQHWYAVGWVDPSDKYCTKIDVSGNPNPVWKTKFTTVVDSELMELSLNVEVYSREPVFLKEKLQGIATINLREFLVKYSKNVEGGKEGNEEVGSFQLRKNKSNKPQGFIDISVRISEEKSERSNSYSTTIGNGEGFNLQNSSGITLGTGPIQAEPPFNPYTHSAAYPNNHWDPYIGMPRYPVGNVPRYPGPGMLPPPPPHPSTNGYVPTLLPQANTQSTSYINMPSSSGVGRGVGPAFGVGMGAGALAAGAVLFGGDFMPGFELPTLMPNPNLSISIDPPF